MNRKEFLKLYNFAHKENPKFNDIMNNFLTDDILSTVEFIYNKEMSHDEWKDFVDKNFFNKFSILKASSKHDKDNFANQLTLLIQGYNKVKDKELGENCLYFLSVSNALFSSNNVPFDIKEEVFLYTYEFLKDDPYFVAREFFKNENISDDFIKRLMKEDPYFLQHLVFTNELNKTDSFPQSIIDRVALIMHSGMYPVINEDMNKAFAFVSEETFEKIKNIMEDDEKSISNLLINKNIKDETRNQIYDEFGCDPTVVYESKTTDYISSSLAKQAIDSVFDMDEIKNRDFSRYSINALKILCNMVDDNFIPMPIQIDLAYRLVSEQSGSCRSDTSALERKLAKNTTYPQVLSILAELKNKNKELIYENKYCPKNLIDNRIRDIIQKAERTIKKNGKLSSDKYYYSLLQIANNHQLNTDTYKAAYVCSIYSHGCRFEDFLISNIIPDDALKVFSEESFIYNEKKYDIDPDVRVIAKSVLECRQKSLDVCKLGKSYLGLYDFQMFNLRDSLFDWSEITFISRLIRNDAKHETESYIDIIVNANKEVMESRKETDKPLCIIDEKIKSYIYLMSIWNDSKESSIKTEMKNFIYHHYITNKVIQDMREDKIFFDRHIMTILKNEDEIKRCIKFTEMNQHLEEAER